ncbi:hypothetical protein E2C01_054902 [Portunus trituberculatus]|uniref:Uncharacterized protein n=1 Tax=Portunus trituberculatus TaxID=210409 RepID=A0A5B7GTA4_PORTR|nr:hypothetical protein [Portunus trituberculatus]
MLIDSTVLQTQRGWEDMTSSRYSLQVSQFTPPHTCSGLAVSCFVGDAVTLLPRGGGAARRRWERPDG